MHEMVRESTAEFQEAAAGHSSDDDADEAEAQPDDYEEYLKRSIPPDKLASSYLKELAEKEKRTLEHLQQKYAEQEEAIKHNPTLGSFLAASQSMERAVFQDTSPSKLAQDYSAIMGEHDNEPIKSNVAVGQGVSSSSHSQPVVIDLLDSSSDADDDATVDDPVQRRVAGYHNEETDGVSSTSLSSQLVSSSFLATSDGPSDGLVGFNKLRDAVAKRASSKVASPASSEPSVVPYAAHAIQQEDNSFRDTLPVNSSHQETTTYSYAETEQPPNIDQV